VKSTILSIVTCISVPVWFAGCGSAPLLTPGAAIPTLTQAIAVSQTRTQAETAGFLSKPAAGSQIDPRNALSAGLVSLVALNEGSGNAFYDAATRLTYHAVTLSGTPAGASPPTWFTPTQGVDYPWGGPALWNNGARAQAIESNLPPSQFISVSTRGYSYAVLLQPLDTTTFGRTMDQTGHAAVTTMYLNVPWAQGKVTTTWVNAAGTAITPWYPFTQNKWILVLCTVQQGLGVMYVNGVEVARDTTVNLAKSVANQSGNLAYNTTGTGGYMMNANFSSWWVWNNRVLTAQEAAEFYKDPWAMLR
jgi:hypothetical protein